MERSLQDIILSMPLTEQLELSHAWTGWYNQVLSDYKRDFALADDDSCQRDFKCEEDVVVFFREALLWWYRKKPQVVELLDCLEMLKTRTCLGQIQSLKLRLDATGISLRKLNLADNM